MAKPDPKRWRRKTSVVKFERTAGWPEVPDHDFKRGTDAPLSRRGRLLWTTLLVLIVAAGVLLVVLSR